MMIRRRTVAVGATVASLVAAIAGIAIYISSSSHNVQAATEPPSYLEMSMTKVADGTGWNDDGTPKKGQHTFIQKANGFSIGDDSPTDGVVASNDTVEYSADMVFTAARDRTVTVTFDVSKDTNGNTWLELAKTGTFCSSGRMITAKWTGANACTYTVPAGVTETLNQSVFFKALDTGGTVRKDNKITVTVKRGGNKSPSTMLNLGSVSVVSAPAADLVIDNGSNPKSNTVTRAERYAQLQSGNDVTGYFDLYPYALKYRDWSSLGASTKGSWAGADRPVTVDVSSFPEGTKWQFDGADVTASNGKLTLKTDKYGNSVSGDHRLSFTIPASVTGYTCEKPADGKYGKWTCSIGDGLKTLEDNKTVYLNVQVIPSSEVFSSDDSNGRQLNMGTGGEPGMNEKKGFTTLDANTGAQSGYPYVNNDWSRFVLQRSDPVTTPPCDLDDVSSCIGYDKTLYAPNTPGKTKFEPENKDYGKAVGERLLDNGYADSNRDDTVAEKTQVRTRLSLQVLSASVCKTAGNCNLAIADDWNPDEQTYGGSLKVYGPNGTSELDASKYTFQWTADPSGADNGDGTTDNHKLSNDTKLEWHDGEPAQSDWSKVSAVRVKLSNDLTLADGDRFAVDFITVEKAVATSGNNAVAGNQFIRDWSDVTVSGSASDKISRQYRVVAPTIPTANVDNLFQITNPSNGDAKVCGYYDSDNTCKANPGYTVTYDIKPSYDKIAYSTVTMKPTVTVTVPNIGLINPVVPTDSEWKVSDGGIKKDAKGNVQSITFEWNSDDGTLNPNVDNDGSGELTDIIWSATISNLAIKSISTTATFKYDLDGGDGYRFDDSQADAEHKSKKADDSNQFTVNSDSSNGGQITAGNSVEVKNDDSDEDVLTWSFNTYARGDDAKYGSNNVTVIRMPDSNKDGAKGDAGMMGTNCKNDAQGNPTQGLDCSWHEYDRGTSEYTGSYLFEGIKLDNSNSSNNVKVEYAVGDANNKTSDNPSDYTWTATLTDANRTKVHAIKLTQPFQTSQSSDGGSLRVAAANGTFTLKPTGTKNQYGNYNHSGDKYVAWMGRNYSDKTTAMTALGNMPWSDVNTIVSGSVSGTLWWDANSDSFIDDTEGRISGKQVDLYASDDIDPATKAPKTGSKPVASFNGKNAPYGHTWSSDDVAKDGNKWSGGYKFSELHSGSYAVVVSRKDGADTDSTSIGVPTKTDKDKDYYSMERNVSNTFSYKGMTYQSVCDAVTSGYCSARSDASTDGSSDASKLAADASGTLKVNAGTDVKDVNFGYYSPHPKVSVNKTLVGQDCTTSKCTVQWAVTLKNEGDVPLSAKDAKLTDVMSSDVYDVTAAINPLKAGTAQVSSTGEYSLVLSGGVLKAWGNNQWGQLGNGQTRSLTKPYTVVGGPGRYTMASAGSAHSAAIGTDGELYTWGLDDAGQLGIESKKPGPSAMDYTAWRDEMSDGNYSCSNIDKDDSLGNGAKTVCSPTKATPAAAKTPLKSVAAAGTFTAIVDADGKLFITNNKSGNVTTNDAWTQMETGTSNFVSVKAYGRYVAALTADNVLHYAGYSDDNGIGSLSFGTKTGIKEYAVGYDHILGVTTDGDLQLVTSAANGSDIGQTTLPNATGVKWKYVAAGYKTSAAVDTDGNLWTWGWNGYGQLGQTVDVKGKPGVAYDDSGNPTNIAAPAKTDLSVVTEDKSDGTGMMSSLILSTKFMLFVNGNGQVKEIGFDPYGKNVMQNQTSNDGTPNGVANVYIPGTVNVNTGKVTEEDVSSPALTGTPVVDTSTSTPIQQIGSDVVNDADKTVTREYALPYDMPVGDDQNPSELNFIFTGTVDRNQAVKDTTTNKFTPGKDKTVVNQAWFDSTQTPFSRTPNALNTNGTSKWTKPSAPKTADLDEDTLDVVNNASCRVGTTFGGEDKEHLFSPENNEDSCDQVGLIIKGTSRDSIFGTITGRYWTDVNENGLQDDDSFDDPSKYEGMTVSLWKTDEKGRILEDGKVMETKTDAKGEYKFENIPIDQNCTYMGANGTIEKSDVMPIADGGLAEGSILGCDSLPYRVVFSKYKNLPFTKQDATGNKPVMTYPAETGNGEYNDGQAKDSDAYAGENEDANGNGYGSSSTLIQWLAVNQNQTKAQEDAGVIKMNPIPTFPMTGRQAGLLLMLIGLLLLVAVPVRNWLIDRHYAKVGASANGNSGLKVASIGDNTVMSDTSDAAGGAVASGVPSIDGHGNGSSDDVGNSDD